MNTGDAWVAVGLVLVTAPLWVGLVSPHESVNGYDVRAVSADPDGENYLGQFWTRMDGVTCGVRYEWGCLAASDAVERGAIRVPDWLDSQAADYVRLGPIARWTFTETENGTVARLENVSAATLLDDIAHDPSPELERQLEAEWVPAHFDVPAQRQVYETSEGYRVLAEDGVNEGASGRNWVRTGVEWLGAGLGVAALLRGQRLRVEVGS
jgi:hypothetical protein